MVVKVTLRGLRLQLSKGKWYVYPRNGGPPLLKGFEGTREQLLERLSEPDMLTVYNASRKRDLNRLYAEGTLGALVAWYQTDCSHYHELRSGPARATRRPTNGCGRSSTVPWT
jgi:hypothetical protein